VKCCEVLWNVVECGGVWWSVESVEECCGVVKCCGVLLSVLRSVVVSCVWSVMSIMEWNVVSWSVVECCGVFWIVVECFGVLCSVVECSQHSTTLHKTP